MKHKLIFAISLIGILAGVATAIYFGIKTPPQPPAFSPASNPYGSGIYAEGIVESAQSSGENLNMYPEVAGTVKEILVSEGQQVKAGDALLRLDDSVQRATMEQQGLQAEAARTLLNELKAQPRKEVLDVAAAQVASAEATLKTAQDTFQKDQAAYQMDPRSVSKDALDSAANAVAVANANLEVARKQYDLTKAGAWVLRHSKSGAADDRAGTGSCGVQRVARQVYSARPAGWRSALDQHHRRKLRIPTGRIRRIHAGRRPGYNLGIFSGHTERALLRGRDSSPAVAFGLQNEGANVDSRYECQDSVGIRSGAAVCFSKDRALGPAPGARGCPGVCP